MAGGKLLATFIVKLQCKLLILSVYPSVFFGGVLACIYFWLRISIPTSCVDCHSGCHFCCCYSIRCFFFVIMRYF